MIIGAGYSGRAFARLAREKGHWAGGTTRSAQKAARLSAAGIEPFLFDDGTISPELAEALKTATGLVACVAPREDGDPFLAAIAGTLAQSMPRLEWIGYLSTVGVYGNHDGAWVDEETELKPVSSRSVQRAAAETDWQNAAAASGLPLAILRLSGIYGPGRNALVNIERKTARRLVKPGQVFNRIHVDDIARAVEFLAVRKQAGIFNVTDDEPSAPQDVVAFAAQMMGVTPPPEIPFERVELSPMARSFYGENKRVCNARITGLGYRLAYPDYRKGLAAMWKSNRWKEEG
jgi:nucleoside-diphosphate-sugar epimerase